MSPKPKPYLTIPQLAAMLGESRTAVYTRAIAGETTAPEPPALPWDARP